MYAAMSRGLLEIRDMVQGLGATETAVPVGMVAPVAAAAPSPRCLNKPFSPPLVQTDCTSGEDDVSQCAT